MRRSRYPVIVLSTILAAMLPVPAGGATADHLLISEFQCLTRVPVSTFGSPYIEICNPTAADIDLGDVHITDATYSPSAQYWFITLSDPAAADPGGLATADFHACFPAGAVLAAGDTLAISLNGSSEYLEAYGRLPDFELFEDGLAPDLVPEMREAFPGAIDAGLGGGDGVPALSPVSESIMLYRWDRMSDLVTDIDYVAWGTALAVRVDKTGQSVGGGTYLPDTPVDAQQPVAPAGPGFGHAFARLNADEGSESGVGGNGLTGHDETAEPLGTTWVDNAYRTPPQAPASPFPAAPIITGHDQQPAAPVAGEPVLLRVDCVAADGVAAVTFHWSVDGGPFNAGDGTDVGEGVWTAAIAGQAEGAAITWYCEAAASGGGVAVTPAAAPLYLLGWTVLPAPDYPDKLLITEVCTLGTDQEFIEICNPGVTEVDLSDYYLTDAVYTPSQQWYWRIAEGNPSANTIGGGVFTDFHARFPAGFKLAAGDTVVVAVTGADNFFNAFRFLPDLELPRLGLLPNPVPDMRWVFGDSLANSIYSETSWPSLTNAGEPIILYHWREGEDRVTDIDIFTWATSSTSTSYLFDKTGQTVGSWTYFPDTPIGMQHPFGYQLEFGNSYRRVDATEGDQITVGGNGVFGRDETSEDFRVTFAMLAADPSRSPGQLFPPEGAWQVVGTGPIVAYGSVSHTWADVNSDGEDELFLARTGPGQANLTIHDVGLVGSWVFDSYPTDEFVGSADCVAGDFDQDGDVDVYLARSGAEDLLYTNYGPEWNWALWGSPLGETGVIATADVDVVDTDLDGWLEIFVANGTGVNQLLDGRYGYHDMLPYSLRHAAGTVGGDWCDLGDDRDPDLACVSADAGVVVFRQDDPREFSASELSVGAGGRDCAWADFDNDGDSDFVLMGAGPETRLYENLGDGGFALKQTLPGVADSTAACAWGDFDNDGFLDLYVTNCGGPNLLWRNESGASMTAVSDTVLGRDPDDRTATWTDIDRDGDLDLYISNPMDLNRIVRNNLDSTNGWLQVVVVGHLFGNQSNLGAIGAVIEVEAGGLVQRRWVGGGTAGPGHAPLAQHFGLGDAPIVDRITVRWPFRLPNGSFHSTVLNGVAINQRIAIEESIYGMSAVDPAPPAVDHLGSAHPNPFNPVTTISFSLGRSSAVQLDVFDVRGRRVCGLVRGETLAAGPHSVPWRGRTDAGTDAPSGIYIYRLRAGEFTASQRMVLIR